MKFDIQLNHNNMVTYHYFYPVLIDHASSSNLKMYVLLQKFPGVLTGRIWFLLGYGWKEEGLKKNTGRKKFRKIIFKGAIERV